MDKIDKILGLIRLLEHQGLRSVQMEAGILDSTKTVSNRFRYDARGLLQAADSDIIIHNGVSEDDTLRALAQQAGYFLSEQKAAQQSTPTRDRSAYHRELAGYLYGWGAIKAVGAEVFIRKHEWMLQWRPHLMQLRKEHLQKERLKSIGIDIDNNPHVHEIRFNTI